MIQLILLLYGSKALRRKWRVIFCIGCLGVVCGAYFVLDSLSDRLRTPESIFSVPMIILGAWSLFTAVSATGLAKALRIGKAALCFFIAALILGAPWNSDILIGFLAGFFLIADAVWRAAAGYVLRFEKWILTEAFAFFEFLFGIWSCVPWPNDWHSNISADVGILLAVWSIGVCTISIRIKRMPQGLPLGSVMTRGWPKDFAYAMEHPKEETDCFKEETGFVHIWTPSETLAPIGITRYIASLDKNGRVSTGHASMELGQDIYISHYPAEEIERDQTQFAKILRSTDENNVAGLFKPSYKEEANEWSASTFTVELKGLNGENIRRFWNVYKNDATYNLTNRNCSTSVAKALDAGLEGAAYAKKKPFFILSLFFMPEFWIAGFLRQQAATMTWTPGMVLDYSRALWYILSKLQSQKIENTNGNTKN